MINNKTSCERRHRGRNFAYQPGRRHALRNVANAGFALVEMLVVILLTAMMSALMIGGIRQLRTFTKLEERQIAQAELDTIADHLASELSGALPLPLGDLDRDGYVPMIGSANSIRFVAVVRAGLSERKLQEMSYSTEPSQDGLILMRKSQPRRRSGESKSAPIAGEEFYNGIDKITLSYLRRTEGSGIWINAWHLEPTLPSAVKIEISGSAEDFELQTIRIIDLGKP